MDLIDEANSTLRGLLLQSRRCTMTRYISLHFAVMPDSTKLLLWHCRLELTLVAIQSSSYYCYYTNMSSRDGRVAPSQSSELESVKVTVFALCYCTPFGATRRLTDYPLRGADHPSDCYGKGKFRKLIIIHNPAEPEPLGRRRSFSKAARPMAGRL